jgi:hypothetical protein
MHPSLQARRRHAEWRNQPGGSAFQGENHRSLQGTSVPRENDGHDPWAPQQTQLFHERRNDSSTSATPGSQNTVRSQLLQQQGGADSRRLHEGENGRRENLPTPPLSLVESRTPYGRPALECLEDVIDAKDFDNSSEQQRCPPPQRILAPWPNDRDNHACRRTSAVRCSRGDGLGVAHDKVPAYRTSQQAQSGATLGASSNQVRHPPAPHWPR